VCGMHVCVSFRRFGVVRVGSSGKMDEGLGCGTAVESLEFVAARVDYGMITVARPFTVKQSMRLVEVRVW